jgi:hypothetical protein
MMDPHRLREQGATSAERILLDSARKDGPLDGAAQQLLASLHLLGGPGPGNALPQTGTEAGAGALKAAATSWLKLGALALAGIAGLGVTSVIVRSRAEKPPVTRPMASPEPSQSTAPEEAEAPRGIAAPSTAPVEATPASSNEEARRSPRAVAPEAPLSAELRLLALARTAMDGHDLRGAQRALDGYQRRFPHGRLEPEATVLRLSVLVQRGKATEARSLGTKLLTDDAYQAYQTTIRSLLRDDGASE